SAADRRCWPEVTKRPDLTHNRTHAARSKRDFQRNTTGCHTPAVCKVVSRPDDGAAHATGHSSRSGLIFAAVELRRGSPAKVRSPPTAADAARYRMARSRPKAAIRCP